jgi:hypothetical protein
VQRAFIINTLSGKESSILKDVLIIKKDHNVMVYYKAEKSGEIFKKAASKNEYDDYTYTEPTPVTDLQELKRYNFMITNKKFIPKKPRFLHLLQESLQATWLKSQKFLENIYTKHRTSLFTGIAALGALSAYFMVKKSNPHQSTNP